MSMTKFLLPFVILGLTGCHTIGCNMLVGFNDGMAEVAVNNCVGTYDCVQSSQAAYNLEAQDQSNLQMCLSQP
jgi:hypothetical protein